MKTGYTLDELRYWALCIEEKALELGLRPFSLEADVVSEEAFIEDVALGGFPLRTPHWTFGKASQVAEFQRRWKRRELLEIVANTNPFVVYLPETNPFHRQLILLARGMGHSDFMRHNRHYRRSHPEAAVSCMNLWRERIQQYRNDFGIEGSAVERVESAARALRHVRSFPTSFAQPSLLKTLIQEAPELTDWEKDILQIIDEETEYFAPQIVTEILRNGWASYWQMRLLTQLKDLDRVVRDAIVLEAAGTIWRFPDIARGEWINPHFVGGKLFADIEHRWNQYARGDRKRGEYWDGRDGKEKIFLVRSMEDDASALTHYLTEKLSNRLGLARFGPKVPHGNTNTPAPSVILEIADEAGWENVRDAYVRHVGFGKWPVITVHDTQYSTKGKLYLKHVWDGRDLDERDTVDTMHHLYYLWRRGAVILETKTRRSRKDFYYICDDSGIRKGSGKVRGTLMA